MFTLLFSLIVCFGVLRFLFFKQKTAYEMRISDWSSDVCSSDLGLTGARASLAFVVAGTAAPSHRGGNLRALFPRQTPHDPAPLDPPHPHVRPDLQLALAAAAAVPGADRRAGDLRLAVRRGAGASGRPGVF